MMYGATGLYQILVLQLCLTLDKGEIICPHYLLGFIFGNNLNFAIFAITLCKKTNETQSHTIPQLLMPHHATLFPLNAIYVIEDFISACVSNL